MLGLIKSVDLESLSDESCFLFDRFSFKVCFSSGPIESKRKIQIVHEHLENTPNRSTSGQIQSGHAGQSLIGMNEVTRTGSKHMNTGMIERNSITGMNEKNGICQTEIDLSSSCIELIVHR